MQLDHRRADGVRGLELHGLRLDEQRDADAGGAEIPNVAREVIVAARDVEAALGGALGPLLRHDAGGVGPVLERDRQHLVGRRHLEIERQTQVSHQPRDVVVGDMTPILA